MRRTRLHALVLIAAVTAVASEAGAQQAPTAPTPYPPPPPGQGHPPVGDGQPPAGYGQPYGYPGYAPYGYGPPPPPPDPMHRPISFSLSVGPGWLGYRDTGRSYDYDLGIAYGVRVGFGLARNLALTLGFEGTGATKGAFYFRQEAYLAGLQVFLKRAFYLRAGLGAADVTQSDGLYLYGGDGPALALNAAAGFELVQAPSSAVAIEGTVTGVKYDQSTWMMSAVAFVFTFF